MLPFLTKNISYPDITAWQERAARDMLLRHERRTMLEAAAENVLAFDEAVYDLRRERMLTAAHLKAAELKLLVLRQARTENGRNAHSAVFIPGGNLC